MTRTKTRAARYVTAAQLKKNGACGAARQTFEALFGKNGRVRVTETTTSALAQSGLSIGWAAAWLLTRKQKRVYDARLVREVTVENTGTDAHALAQKLMLGVEPNRTKIDRANGLPYPSSYHTLQSIAEDIYAVRLRAARAAAFTHAYNSPR